MLKQILLPNYFKLIGWILLIPSAVLGFFLMLSDLESTLKINSKVFALYNDEIMGSQRHTGIISTDITNTLVGVFFILGAMMVGFSKEKKEDEYVANLRLSSLMWAVWVNYVLLLLSFIFIYGMGFFHVMIYNMFTVLIIFIGRFNIKLFINRMIPADEK
jgi:heme/copper-type cytochrome/quinol oxidase subunit 2